MLTTRIVPCFRGVDYFNTCRGIRRSTDRTCSEQVLGLTSCPSDSRVPDVSFYFHSDLLDFLTFLDSHQWMFVTDTVDAVYRPEDWSPESLLDQLAELVRDLPEPKVCPITQPRQIHLISHPEYGGRNRTDSSPLYPIEHPRTTCDRWPFESELASTHASICLQDQPHSRSPPVLFHRKHHLI